MRYLIGILIVIVVIIFIIIKLLSGGGSKPVVPPSLSSYANTDTTVRYIIDNPTQAPQNHRDIIIDVGNGNATLTVTKGYNGEVVRSQSYGTSEASYADFLLALDHSGDYTKGNTNPKLQDERGYCATGNRYSYDIVDGSGNRIQHFWYTSCGNGTFKGKTDIVDQLFETQIPDFDSLTQDVDY